MSDETTQAKNAQLLIDVREVATILNVSSRSVWRLLSEGKLVAPVRIGGSVRWRRIELIQWIDEGCPTPLPSRRPR